MVLIALVFALAAADPASAPAQTDTLGQFRAGHWLCADPDEKAMTCSVIDRLSERADGTLLETGETLLAPDKAITLETTSVVRITADTLCGTVDLADLQTAIVRVDGTALPSDRNAQVLAKISAGFAPMAGKTVCEHLRLDKGQLVNAVQIEQMDRPIPPKPVRWISPADGYRVAPRLP